MEVMSTPEGDRNTRPRQVTTAAWLIMGGSLLLVLAAFQTVSGLHTLETRETIERMLTEQPMAGTGLDLESVRSVLHVAALVLGGCATATAILGYQVLRRDRTARIASVGAGRPAGGCRHDERPVHRPHGRRRHRHAVDPAGP